MERVEAMSNPLQVARDMLAEEMARFETTLMESLEPQKPYLTETEYAIYRRGKKLRPILLLLSARLVSPNGARLPDKVIKAATSLEMLHVATLIHDDIVDEAPTRRGLKTVYSERGAEMAILLGDLQFVQAVRCFADGIDTQRDMNLVKIVLDVGFQICCGEIDELTTDPNWKTPALVQRYYRTIDRKTAVLFGLACESGTSLVGARTRATYAISRFGRRLGRAFQIMDDLIDLVVDEASSGKRPGADLRQRRLSLPIIYAMDELPPDHVVHGIMKGAPYTADDIQTAVNAIVLSKGFFRAYSEARDAIFEGLAYLNQFPDNPYRRMLSDIALFVVNRSLDGNGSPVR